jgi:hypothetical protein
MDCNRVVDPCSDPGYPEPLPQGIALGLADQMLVKDMDRTRTTRRGD